MPLFKCPCGREKIIMAGKVKSCSRCNERFVPVKMTRSKVKENKKQETVPRGPAAEETGNEAGTEIERAKR